MKKMCLLPLFILLTCASAWAFDFGLLLDQNADYGGYDDSGSFGYSGSLLPRFSALLGNSGDVYVSAGLNVSGADDKWSFVPELLRTELTFLMGSLELKAGRVYHADPLELIADGLFDGLRLSLAGEAGTFSVGAFYTGLLYKDRANILMTEADREIFAGELDYTDFAATYFAPRRVVSSLGWEHLSLGGPLQARAALLAQFDLSQDAPLHSQYLAVKLSLPGHVFSFDTGGILELIEEGENFGTALAAEICLRLTPPGSLPQRLSLLGRISSGSEGSLAAFQPVTTKEQGGILKVGLTGLSVVSLDYLVQPSAEFTAGITVACFFRNDLETYGGYPLSGDSGGHVLGTEFFGRLLWSPFSDLQMNLGGGVFLPSLGDANPGAEVSWRVELNIIVSIL